ncbi:MAG: hypothetical protein IKA49_01505 [Alistipes sp.]|nr:hypothetical protein [Alistipes sp.]
MALNGSRSPVGSLNGININLFAPLLTLRPRKIGADEIVFVRCEATKAQHT